MSITASSNGKSFELIPAGTYIARCYSMIHIGTIKENIMGTEKELNKVRIGWELPTETKVFDEAKGEQPLVISKEFTLSMHEKSNLRKFLESWRGKGFKEEECKDFDITKLLGKPCMLSIIHKTNKAGNNYALISGVTTLPKGTNCPDQINPTFEFSFEQYDADKLEGLPDWLKDKIKSSKEYKELSNPEHVEVVEEEDDGLPF